MQLLNSYLLISCLNSSETKPVHDPASSLPVRWKVIQSPIWREGSKGTGDKEYVKGLEALALGSSW
jgi:hypothetical protein